MNVKYKLFQVDNLKQDCDTPIHIIANAMEKLLFRPTKYWCRIVTVLNSHPQAVTSRDFVVTIDILHITWRLWLFELLPIFLSHLPGNKVKVWTLPSVKYRNHWGSDIIHQFFTLTFTCFYLPFDSADKFSDNKYARKCLSCCLSGPIPFITLNSASTSNQLELARNQWARLIAGDVAAFARRLLAVFLNLSRVIGNGVGPSKPIKDCHYLCRNPRLLAIRLHLTVDGALPVLRG